MGQAEGEQGVDLGRIGGQPGQGLPGDPADEGDDDDQAPPGENEPSRGVPADELAETGETRPDSSTGLQGRRPPGCGSDPAGRAGLTATPGLPAS